MAHKSRTMRLEDGRLTLSGDTEGDWADGGPPQSCRQRLDGGLNSVVLHSAVILAVWLDLLLITALLLIDLRVIQAPPSDSPQTAPSRRDVTAGDPDAANAEKDPTVKQAENIMHYIQIALLGIFMLEILLRVVAKGVDLIYDRWQVFDSLVVLVAFSLYVALTLAVPGRRVTYAVGYVIVLRLWRVHRIHRDVEQNAVRKVHKVIIARHKAWKAAAEELKAARAHIDNQQMEISVLKQEAALLYERAQASPGRYSSTSQPSLFEDPATSDEECYPAPRRLRTTVYVEQASTLPGYGRRGDSIPNGALPGGSPGLSSLGHLPGASGHSPPRGAGSLPGTPRHVGSLGTLGGSGVGAGSLASLGSSGRIPDLVEHTQTADLRPNTTLPRAPAPATTPASDPDPDPDPATDPGPRSDRTPRGSDSDLAGVERSRDITVTSPMAADLGAVARDADDSAIVEDDISLREAGGARGRGRPPSGCSSDSGAGRTPPQLSVALATRNVGGRSTDKQKLIPPAAGRPLAEGTKLAFSNPGYRESLTEEELLEIHRVSQVPFDQFGSVSHLVNEGIPMTDL